MLNTGEISALVATTGCGFTMLRCILSNLKSSYCSGVILLHYFLHFQCEFLPQWQSHGAAPEH